MFYLLGLFLYVKGRLSPGNRRGLFWTGAGLSYLLGLFTKENVAILPLFAALYEIYFFRNVDLGPRGKKGLVYSMGLVLLIGLLMCLFWGQRYIDVIIEGYQVRNFTMAERVLTQFRVVLYYVMLLVYPAPSRLNLDYDFPTSHGILDPPATLLSILIVFSLIGYGLWSARKRPLISYFILWYFGNLVIESSIFPLEMVYEHRLYLPSIGPFVLFTVLVVKGWEKVRERMRHGSELGVRSSEREAATFLTKKGDLIRARMTDTDTLSSDYPLWGLFLILAVSLAWASYERNKVWRDPTALWEDCVKKSPRKDRPYYNLGQEYYTQGRFQDSIEALKTANRLNPKDVKILNNLGAAYRKTGRYPEAIETYKEALRLNPTESEPYNNLGLAYYHLGRHPEAIEAFKEAIRRKPGNEELYYNLGVAYTALGNHPAAIEAYHKAIQIKHDHVQARVNLAVSYLMLKKRDLALEQYQVLKDLDRGRAEKVLGLINSNR
jgi:Flp pilus assembly protein TadD